MTKPSKADDFLQNMKLRVPEPPPEVVQARQGASKPKKPAATRAGLKHIGGYFEMDMVEKVAVLRARLRLDNSELIKLAIDDLHRKHMAKRAFGDA
jgi:hypothetical protein